MKTIKWLDFFIFLFLISCSTIQFGTQESQYTEGNETQQIRELNLNFNYKIMGINIKGDKSIVEAVFLHPDQQTLFICISYPKIGILKTTDNGKTFTSHFFRLSTLDKIYGYSEDDSNSDENKKSETEKLKPQRCFYHAAYSKVTPNKMIISMGPYLLISNDKGENWETKNIFFDPEKASIRDIYITTKDDIIVAADNKIAISTDWGKKWQKKIIKIENIPYFKLEYLTGLYDNSNDILYASLKYHNEPDELLSEKSYQFLYNLENNNLKSGLYFSKDKGSHWIKSTIPIPVVLWENNNKIYASSLYPLQFYQYSFPADFTESNLYKSAKLDQATQNIKNLIDIITQSEPDDYQILSQKNNKLLILNRINQEYSLVNETNFNNLYNGIIKIQKLDVIQWRNTWFSQKKSNNFCYEYNPWQFFKRWTGMQTNSPILYSKDIKNNIYYRLRPHPQFLKTFMKYSIDNQAKLNSINPFLKKPNEIEFFDPKLDPLNGTPIILESSNDSGISWQPLFNDIKLNSIIDPLNTKRSWYYWYHNIEQKKIFKLQLTFGSEKGIDFLSYPTDLMVLDQNLLIRINYFSITNSYKDIYFFPK